MINFYTPGGTLPPNTPSYVRRQADTELYQNLKQHQFCYILNSRQMGKSSLVAHVAFQLRQEDTIVLIFDISKDRQSANIEQWYNGLLDNLINQLLDLNFDLETQCYDFWAQHQDLSPSLRWIQAIRRVLLTQIQQQPIVLCFDEIDAVRSLSFATDDFFAAIRSCYNERAHNPDLQRLTFCLVGTASPTDLMSDAQTTPFDIGQPIDLTGFTLAEAMPLALGLQNKAANPEVVLRAILDWTGGQPFLTQKVCDLFCRHTDTPLASGQETTYVKQLIQTHIIEHWEAKDEPPHFTTIRNRLIERENSQRTWQLLSLCRSILSVSQLDEQIKVHEMELRLTGLMVKQPGEPLRVFNKIYAQVFNQQWLAQAQRETLAENPYVGLSAFQAEDAGRFFGRKELTAKLLEKCRDLETKQLPRLLPILGPSGSGKSSVARAGLIPALQHSQKNVHIEIFTPTESPLKVLAQWMQKLVGQEESTYSPSVEELLKNQSDTLSSFLDPLPNTASFILLIDQFEEVYTLCENAAEGTAFIDNLLTAVQPESKNGLLVILTLRSDFLGATQRHSLLNKIIANQSVIVPMMDETELRDAITKPAEQAGYPLESATVDLLLEQAAGREGALPLLQFALTALWEGLRQGIAPSETLRQMGGVGGALAGKAEDIYQSLSEAEKLVARRAFLKLIQLGEGTKDTRRRVKITEMVAHGEDEKTVHAILSQFAHPDARLVTLSEDKQHHKTAEVTHEALLEHWQTLKDWLAESREDLRFEHRLNDAITNWQHQQKADGLLWRSPDLDLLQKYYQHAHQDMTAVQVDFYQASARKQRFSKKVIQFTASALVILALVSGIGTYLSFQAEMRINQARNEAEQAQLIAQQHRREAKRKIKEANTKAERKVKNAALIAQQERDNAKKYELIAQQERDNAKKYEQIAQQERDKAKESEKRAKKQRIEADKQKQAEQKVKAQIALIERLAVKSTLATQFPNNNNGYYEQALLLAVRKHLKKKIMSTSRSALLRVIQAQQQRKSKSFVYGHFLGHM
jgi:hypothetical protein